MIKNKPIRDTLHLIKAKWKKILIIAVLDILFVLLIYNMRFVTSTINGKLFTVSSSLNETVYSIVILIFIIVESLMLIAVYSFFKYLILDNVQGLFIRKELGFKRFFSFLKLNWIINMIIMVLYIVSFIFVLGYMKKTLETGIGNTAPIVFNAVVFILFSAILSLYLYTFLNIAQNIFLKQSSLKKILRKTWTLSFKLRSYKIYWSNIKILLVYLIFFVLFYAFMEIFVLTSVFSYMKYGSIFKIVMYSISLLVGYFLLLFNRINFYKNFVIKSNHEK